MLYEPLALPKEELGTTGASVDIIALLVVIILFAVIIIAYLTIVVLIQRRNMQDTEARYRLDLSAMTKRISKLELELADAMGGQYDNLEIHITAEGGFALVRKNELPAL